MSRLKRIFLVSLIGSFFLLIHSSKADSTFFDNSNDAFVMGSIAQKISQTPALVSRARTLKPPITCIIQWQCEPWTLCQDGKQLRTCKKQSKNCPTSNEERTETTPCNSPQESIVKTEQKHSPTSATTTNMINKQKTYDELTLTKSQPIKTTFLFSTPLTIFILVSLLITIVLHTYKKIVGPNKRQRTQNNH